MNLLASSVIYKNEIVDSYYYFLDNIGNNRISYSPTSSQIEKFNNIIEKVKQNFSFHIKFELIFYQNNLIVRIRKSHKFINYLLVNLSTSIDIIFSFLKKKHCFNKANLKIQDSNYNLIAGRYSEKLIHEWLSHPAEDDLLLNKDFSLSKNSEVPDNSAKRLTNIKYRGNTFIKLPENFLYLRYVNKGFYSTNEKKVKISVKEAFMKKNGLVQSVCPFNCSFHFDDLNKCFNGTISNTKYSSGFFCTKNNETVFGKIESSYLIFKNIKVAPEDYYHE